ncbi:hypothetical protein JW960_29560 [candidate division KSB1 bacterium]|nr:hypothetical protein [candidate division KSB1 bacterium]
MSARRTRAEIARRRFDMILKFIESGQSPKQFCQAEQINYATFQYWLKKYRNQNLPTTAKQPLEGRFVPLTLSSSASEASACGQGYTIEYRNGVALHIRQSIELHSLIQLIRAQEN